MQEAWQTLEVNRERYKDLKYRPGCMIDPRTSTQIAKWDSVTAIALVFTALVTPCAYSSHSNPHLASKPSHPLC